MAIVVDEYGGTSGLITLRILLKRSLAIFQMNLIKRSVYSKLDDLNYVFEGKTTLKDFYKVIQIEEAILKKINLKLKLWLDLFLKLRESSQKRTIK